jgi:hypothetical protein
MYTCGLLMNGRSCFVCHGVLMIEIKCCLPNDVLLFSDNQTDVHLMACTGSVLVSYVLSGLLQFCRLRGVGVWCRQGEGVFSFECIR